MRKRLSLVLLNIFLCLSALAVLCGYTATAAADGPEYTVKFYLDGAKTQEYDSARQTVTSGDCAVVPVTPTKDGNYFLYWKLGTEKFSFKTPITADTELTAEWLTPDESVTVTEMFSVKFVVDGKVVNEQSVEKGADAMAPTGFFLPDGKLFLKWDREFTNVQTDIVVTANLTAAEYTVKFIGFNDVEIKTISDVQYGDPVDTTSVVIPIVANYHVDASNKFIGDTACITEDCEIYVNYIPNEYTATFKVGEDVYGTVQTVSYGEYVECPTIPEKHGYIFKGWYVEGAEDTAFDFNTIIESNITLFAKYQVIENKKYDVTFYNYDGVQYGAVQRVEEGKTAIPAGRPTREGYEFRGWFISGETKTPYDFSTPVTADISLNAMFKINDYTVTVISDGEVVSTQTVKYGGNAVEPTITTKEGYIFTGFDASFKDIRKDTTINATFRLKTFAVMFIDSYGKKMCTTQYVEYGKSATAPKVPELEGYTFLSWSGNYEEIKEDISLVPLYEKITYEFTYMLGDETYATKTVEYGHLAVSLVPTQEGYIFRGWFIDENFENAYDFSTEVKAEKGTEFVLYGAFDVKPAEQFTVTFTVDGAIYAMYSVEYGKNCPTPLSPNKYGYIFTGWDGEYSNVTEDLVIAATFEKMKFTVRPMGFMGAGTEHEFKVDYGTYLTDDMFPPEVPDKEGYTFVGWNYDPDMPVTQDITVFAGYTINVYTVTFIVEGKVHDVQQVEYNGHAYIPAQPPVSGKSFGGWYVGEKMFNFRDGITADVEVTAKLITVERTIYYYLDNEYYKEEKYEVGAKIIPLAAPELPEHTDFNGWSEIPEIMPNATVSVYGYTRTHHEYTITYYVNNKVYAQDTYYDGDAVTMQAAPSAEDLARLADSDTVFIAWGETLETMPTYNCSIDATLKKYYYLTYSIDGGYYREVLRVLEGAAITPKGAPELKEGVVFVRWKDEPETMPQYNTVVEGVIMRNYIVRYYVNGVLYRETEVFQGSEITPIDLPTEQYEDFVVDAWGEIPEIMPTQDVRVDAIIRLKYTIKYYIDNEICATVKIPFGDDIPEFIPETDETAVKFVGWINLPADGKMPAEDINIYATVKHCFTLTYKVNGEVYKTERLFEGERIVLAEYEGSMEGMVFEGWNERDVLEFMPANDYVINAGVRTLVKYPIIYYAYGIEFARFEIYEGYPVTPLKDVPKLENPNEEFFGWIGEPQDGVMPNREVVVYADIRGYYKLTYIVDGEIYFEDSRVLQGTPITMIEYGNEREDVVFLNWDRTISEMPSYDIEITASIRKLEKHKITYYLNNEYDGEFEGYETKPIPSYGTPKSLKPNEIFDGWDNEPPIMPNYDMDVYGYS
ncbi:MAG: InlB B-repeat-containing protein, partial [Clostridia bacterium]|nr:InlB B-repeat-containing protein [Clostridia bacterium]